MSTRFRRLGLVRLSFLFVAASVFALSAFAQTEDDDLIDWPYFSQNVQFFIAACDGEPEIIPISNDSLSVPFLDYHPYHSYNSELNISHERKITWIEANCSLLFANLSNVPDPVIPDNGGFGPFTVTVSWLRGQVTRLEFSGKVVNMSNSIAERDTKYPVEFYTDFDLSRSFDPSELLNIEGLSYEQIQWLYSGDYIYNEEHLAHFEAKNNYLETGAVYLKVAEFAGGPLDGRDLYFINVMYEAE